MNALKNYIYPIIEHLIPSNKNYAKFNCIQFKYHNSFHKLSTKKSMHRSNELSNVGYYQILKSALGNDRKLDF